MKNLILTLVFVCISSAAWAESTYSIYLQIPSKAPFDYVDFSARYLELSGEHAVANPQQNIQETHYIIGSWRMTEAVADQLASEYPLVTVSARGVWPVGFQTIGIE